MEGQEAAAMEGTGEDMMRQMMGEFSKMGEKEVGGWVGVFFLTGDTCNYVSRWGLENIHKTPSNQAYF